MIGAARRGPFTPPLPSLRLLLLLLGGTLVASSVPAVAMVRVTTVRAATLPVAMPNAEGERRDALPGAQRPEPRAAQARSAEPTSQAAAPAGPTEVLIAEARVLIDRGEARAAIAKLAAAPGAADDPRVQQALGVAYYHADEYAKAVDLLQRARQGLPEASVERREAEQVLGLALHLMGRDADAIPWLEKTRGWAADNLELNFVLGQAYIQTSQPARAREALARTFGVAPDSAAARVLAAQLMIRLQMEPLAEAELLAAVKQDARVSRAHYLLGQIALFRGRLDEALDRSRQEIALNPTDAMAFYQAGDVLVRQAKWDEAIRMLQQSLWINPFYSGPYILLGRAYMKKEQPVTAEAMLRRAIEFDPNNRMAHYLLAQLLQQAGRDEEAKREFAEAERLQGQPGRP